MRIKKTFIAEDGTEFGTEEECFAYEVKYSARLLNIVMLNERYEVLTPDVDSSHIFFVKLDSEEAIDAFHHKNVKEGCSIDGIEEPGCYYYDDDICWMSIDRRIQELNDEKRSLEKAKSILENPESYANM